MRPRPSRMATRSAMASMTACTVTGTDDPLSTNWFRAGLSVSGVTGHHDGGGVGPGWQFGLDRGGMADRGSVGHRLLRGGERLEVQELADGRRDHLQLARL